MGLTKLSKKLEDYNARLERGQAKEIKPDHVRQVLEKLRKKSADLEAGIAREDDPDRLARLSAKLGIAQAQVERAEWLLDRIG